MTRDLETVVTAYAECALWSSMDFGEGEELEPESVPFDDWATVQDIAPETMTQMREDCAAMIEGAAEVPGSDWWTDEQLGHDFWLTRNGHGAGFWDRGQGEAGEELTALTRPYGAVDLYAHQGKVYAD